MANYDDLLKEQMLLLSAHSQKARDIFDLVNASQTMIMIFKRLRLVDRDQYRMLLEEQLDLLDGRSREENELGHITLAANVIAMICEVLREDDKRQKLAEDARRPGMEDA